MAIVIVCMECHKLSKKNAGGMVTEACESGGGVGKEWGRFGKEEEWENSVVKGCCCFG